ncbi:MAG: copper resistance protein CopC [Candidatus Rariloculaceae bacterium]
MQIRRRSAKSMLRAVTLIAVSVMGLQTVYAQQPQEEHEMRVIDPSRGVSAERNEVSMRQMHGITFGISAAEAGLTVESAPIDDSVLANAPNQLGLGFEMPVRLVKWVLYDEDREWVDINFRYDPRVNAQFSLSLPSLQQTEYYSVEWAILDDVEQLIKGVYNFSFGPGAEVASVIRAREGQMDHSMHEM